MTIDDGVREAAKREVVKQAAWDNAANIAAGPVFMATTASTSASAPATMFVQRGN